MKMNLSNFKGALAVLALFASTSLVSCGGGGNAGGSDSTSTDDAIIGAGSSFDNPLFSNSLNNSPSTTRPMGSRSTIRVLVRVQVSPR
jgi:hypothetical protein